MAGRCRHQTPTLMTPPEAEEVDYISHSPDAIIHHIFSFLPFKDVVKTSLLSKQWRFTWTSTPYIDISLPSEGVVPLIIRALELFTATKIEKFHLDAPLIIRALELCTATKIEKFHLDATMYDLCIPADLDWWFGFASERKVEDASLSFGHDYHFVPRFLCECASLVKLRVSRCLFSWDIIIYWPSLKKLCIHDVTLDNDMIMKILSGCPVLESLTLRFSHGWCEVQIDSRCLRELVIEGAYISLLDISAPNLLLLRLSGGFSLTNFRLNGASSLAEAELNFEKPTASFGNFSDQWKCLLEQLQHFAKITIGSWCLEVPIHFALKALYRDAQNLVKLAVLVFSAKDHYLFFISRVVNCCFHTHACSISWEVKGTPYLSSRWRNIIVYSAVCKSNLLGMAYMLQSSPLLERVVICNPKSDNIVCEPYQNSQDLCDFDEKQLRRRGKEFCCGKIISKGLKLSSSNLTMLNQNLCLPWLSFFSRRQVDWKR